MNVSFRDTIAVRKGEELNEEILQKFIRENIVEAPIGDLEIEQFGAGHSNLTYLLRIGEWEAVLRRPPHGPVAKKAHDMEREYTILSNLHPLFPTAPKPYIFSNDHSFVGSPFFIMERRKGILLDKEFPLHLHYDKELGRKISEHMVDKLVELHQVDYTKTELLNISRPNGFMERQVAGWIKRYEHAKTDKISGVEELTTWLLKNIPVSPKPTVIHYDYKLNNAMFSEDFDRITGLFDWEMTTIGDPLADVGVALSYWVEDGDSEELKNALFRSITVKEGFFTREEFLEDYANKSGRDISNIHFYLTFSYFKMAVIAQQIYFRYFNAQTSDERFSNMNQAVENLMQYAFYYSRGVLPW
ncbi:phosphotransferase family protein [Peribacillus butanolivorans]|uniref:phosphotransferase family protein n=1 Tax=Peribacillus butanolivorans TaxID=421767 RepID=UPI0036DA9E33